MLQSNIDVFIVKLISAVIKGTVLVYVISITPSCTLARIWQTYVPFSHGNNTIVHFSFYCLVSYCVYHYPYPGEPG